MDKIAEKKLTDEVNVVIVSDHGMLTVNGDDEEKVIEIEEYLDFNDVEMFLGGGAIAMIMAEEGREEEVRI